MKTIDERLPIDLHHLSGHLQELASLETLLLMGVAEHLQFSGDVEADGLVLTSLLGGSSDFETRPVQLPGRGQGLLLWLSSMTETTIVDEQIFGAISKRRPYGKVAKVQKVSTLKQGIDRILDGQVLLLAPVEAAATALDASAPAHRQVTEPRREDTVTGPQDAFTEDTATNISLIRARLKDPRLRIEPSVVGSLTQTGVHICFIRGLTNDAIVDEVRRRLREVKSPTVLGSSYIAETTADDPWTVFPTTLLTERPDTVVASLAEGRVAILTQGTPDALILPVSFWSSLQAADDYYETFWVATFLRVMRGVFLVLALVAPALYIAITSFQPQMLPTPLLLTIARSREGIPFPSLIEAFIMEGSLEVIREAGIRLPSKLGESLSIVGALILGQAAVASGLVSWPMVIIVSVTAIANFALPRWPLALAIRLLRFGLMVLAGIFGLPGILVGLATIIGHLVSLRSFGLPYLAPIGPLDPEGLKDTLVRVPHWMPTRRPRLLDPHWLPRPGRRPRPPARAGTV